MSNILHIEAIHTVADAIEKLPSAAFNMGKWMNSSSDYHGITPNWDDRIQMAINCQTVAGIAGWTCVLLDERWIPYGYVCDWPKRAMKLLGLSIQQAQMLFQPVVGADVACSYADITPQDAANTLRNLANTGHVEWQAQPKQRHYTEYADQPTADLSRAIRLMRAATPHQITAALNAMRTPNHTDGKQQLRAELHHHDTTVAPPLGSRNPPTDTDIAVIAAAIRIAETARPCPATRYDAVCATAMAELRRIAYPVSEQDIKAPAPDEPEPHDGAAVPQTEPASGGGVCLMPDCCDEPPPGAHLCVEHTPARALEPSPRYHNWKWHHHADHSHAHWVNDPDHQHEPLDHGTRNARPDDDNPISETERERRIYARGWHDALE